MELSLEEQVGISVVPKVDAGVLGEEASHASRGGLAELVARGGSSEGLRVDKSVGAAGTCEGKYCLSV